MTHFTFLQLNFNTTGRTAYIWNTNISSFQLLEILLFIIIISLATFVLLPTIAILPILQARYNTRNIWDSVCLKAFCAPVILLTETIFHRILKSYIIPIDTYIYIRQKIEYTYAIGLFGIIYGVSTPHCSSTKLIEKPFTFLYIFISPHGLQYIHFQY